MQIVIPKETRPEIRLGSLDGGEVFGRIATKGVWMVGASGPGAAQVQIMNVETGALEYMGIDNPIIPRPDLVLTTRDNCKSL